MIVWRIFKKVGQEYWQLQKDFDAYEQALSWADQHGIAFTAEIKRFET